MSAMKLTDYTNQTGELNSTAIMGWLILVGNRDELADRQTVVDAMNTNGFDGSKVPVGIRKHEAFRYAAKKIGERTVVDPMTSETWKMFLRDVSTSGVLVKHLVAEKVEARTTLRYQEITRISYDPSDEKVSLQALGHIAPQAVATAASTSSQELLTWWNKAFDCLDYQKMRGLLVDTMNTELQAVQVRRSVYYIPNRNKETLQRFVDVFTGFTEVNIELIPLVDLAQHKEMVVTAFREQAMTDYLDLIERAGKLVADKKEGKSPRVNSARKLVDEYKTMTLANKDHIADMNLDIDILKSTAQTAREAVEQAMSAVLQ